MKKAIYRTNYLMRALKKPEEEHLIGFDSEYMWRSVDYFKGPDKPGKYLVINKDGCISEMFCTGTHAADEEEQLSLFHLVAELDYGSQAFLDDREMTDSDIMSIYRAPWGRWYTVDYWQDEDNYGSYVHEYSESSDKYPLYFLDINLDEPIKLKENGEISGVTGIQYYTYGESNDLIKEEE